MTKEMREPTFFVLMALLSGPKHGYALITEVAFLSDNALNLQVGTLYGALDRLQKEGLVSQSGTEIVSGRHRRYVEITEDGVTALEAESARLRSRERRVTAMLTQRRIGFAS
jgi:PadR family transcriptional regulator, regulatory protein PadR